MTFRGKDDLNAVADALAGTPCEAYSGDRGQHGWERVMSSISAERRAEAVVMYAKCRNFRTVAVAFNVSHESVCTWVREATTMHTSSPAKVREATRGPIYVNGVRLGRLALWT